MEMKSNVILGLKKGNYFTISERHQIIQEMISSRFTKQDIWRKFTREDEERGQILTWMRKLGYNEYFPTKSFKFGANNIEMPKKKIFIVSTEESFENLQLKKRILSL